MYVEPFSRAKLVIGKHSLLSSLDVMHRNWKWKFNIVYSYRVTKFRADKSAAPHIFHTDIFLFFFFFFFQIFLMSFARVLASTYKFIHI